MFDSLKEYISSKPINFTIDIVIVVAVIGILLWSLIKTKKELINYVRSFGFIFLAIFAKIFELEFTYYVILFVTCGFAINNFFFISKEERKVRKKQTKNENHSEIAETRDELISTFVKTMHYLAVRQIGAIITFEKNDSLNSYIEKSVRINAYVSEEILKTIFFPNTALHDGAIIIQNGKIACAGAYYPLTDKTDIPSSFGTRHRAAIGISEETDALSIVISEETGLISYTLDGTITTGISDDTLRNILEQNLFIE